MVHMCARTALTMSHDLWYSAHNYTCTYNDSYLHSVSFSSFVQVQLMS